MDLTASVPPEFGADVLLRIVESHRAIDPELKFKLIRNAFELAASAQEPVKMTVSFPLAADTTTGYQVVAFRVLKLDRLSLQSRAVDDALAINPGQGRALFDQLHLPNLQPLSCDEPLAYDLDPYYKSLKAILRMTFTLKEVKEGRRDAFISSFAGSLQSHAQVAPLSELLVSADLSPEELADATMLFAASLDQLRGDPRSFAAATSENNSAELGAFPKLVSVLRKNGMPTAPLLRSIRNYFVANLSGLRCAESSGSKEDPLPQAASFFNHEFAAELQPAQLRPIDVNEITSAQIAPKFILQDFWQSKEASQLQSELQSLRSVMNEDSTFQPKRATPEWQNELHDFLLALEAWQGNGEPEDVAFHEKCELYEYVIDVIPPSPQRSQALENFVDFLEQTRFQEKSRMQWLLPALVLLGKERAREDHPEILRAFLDSRDPTLSLYARFEMWAARASGT